MRNTKLSNKTKYSRMKYNRLKTSINNLWQINKIYFKWYVLILYRMFN